MKTPPLTLRRGWRLNAGVDVSVGNYPLPSKEVHHALQGPTPAQDRDKSAGKDNCWTTRGTDTTEIKHSLSGHLMGVVWACLQGWELVECNTVQHINQDGR